MFNINDFNFAYESDKNQIRHNSNTCRSYIRKNKSDYSIYLFPNDANKVRNVIGWKCDYKIADSGQILIIKGNTVKVSKVNNSNSATIAISSARKTIESLFGSFMYLYFDCEVADGADVIILTPTGERE